MNKKDISDIVFKKLKNLTKENFNGESDIYKIGIDSLDLIELVTEVEDEFNAVITDEELENIKFVNDIIDAFINAVK